ncbi:glycosyltransferase family 2 protein [Pararhodobacter sp. SW119]|uniref:glycosyltransferase family 2 protein n=1 Tax=Pararhodobacter sp. SW119 TaxID=2780075 RepID=UPI001FD8537C|nr:glycosyltransferase family 2 protein [Pararhodobacter sp. SW119]
MRRKENPATPMPEPADSRNRAPTIPKRPVATVARWRAAGTAGLVPAIPPRRRWLYLLIGLGWLVSAAAFWLWWLRPHHATGDGRYGLITILLLCLFFLQAFFLIVSNRASRSAAPDPVPGRFSVAMIVTKTPAEPFAVVRRALMAMRAQDYPHDTWLADEDPDTQTLTWCRANGVRVSTRKGCPDYHRASWPRRARCKEGNLAYFYDHWGYEDYDIVVQLDADHVPQPGYLREMLRPFADPGVGYVSAPSICAGNASQSWAARTRLHTEAAFHGALQAGYSNGLAPMCIGSHYAVRTQALHAVGGLGPDLAEDHSTTLLLNAGGWRGVHALDALAVGDGPASVADMAVQEFQWSRSLVTLLLAHTRRYLPTLPWRLRAQFLFCQILYPLIALTMMAFYLLPIVAVIFDLRYAHVTYPAFLAHAVPPILFLLLHAAALRRDGIFRPASAPLLSWERVVFPLLQWPWVLWGCVMAVRDRLTGRFVDFRITPKGDATTENLPPLIPIVYGGLATAAIMPVLLSGRLEVAGGFLLLSLLTGALYVVVLALIVGTHLARTRTDRATGRIATLAHLSVPGLLTAALLSGLSTSGLEGLHVLSLGLEPIQLVRVEAAVSGAGRDGAGTFIYRLNLDWLERPGPR